MNSDQHTIYVSYADADEDWVVHFVNGLKVYLRKQLGEIDDNFILAKFMRLGPGNKQEILQQHLQASKYLLIIMSPAYLKAMGNSEIASFGKIDALILVEHNKVTLPNNLRFLKELVSYQFWYKDDKGRTMSLANPVPTTEEPQYFRLLAEIAYDIVKHLNDSLPQNQPQLDPAMDDSPHQNQSLSDPPTTEVSNTTSLQKIFRVFIHAIEQDRDLAIEVKKHLGTEIMTSLLPGKSVKLTVTEREEYLKQYLLDCHAVIIVRDSASLKWTYMQVQNTFKIQNDRKNNHKSDFSVIAIFNKPPPDNLEQELGLQVPNLRIWNCADIVNECVPEFKRIAFS